jgi:multidrug efflux pump
VFWGPMAVAIMGGLIVATVLTLLALPAMYAAWFRVRREAPPSGAAAEPALPGRWLRPPVGGGAAGASGGVL